MKNWIVGLMLAGGLGLSAAASAQTVGVRASTPIYAGPSVGYPVVGYIRSGAFVSLNGCLGDYAWCDVNDGVNRGWVDPDNLYVYQNSVPYAFYDASSSWFTYPIVTFFLNDYWNRHYSGRAWYRERSRFDRWDWRHDNRGWNRGRQHAPPHHGRPNPPHHNRPPVDRPPHARPPVNRPPPHVSPSPGPNLPGRPNLGQGSRSEVRQYSPIVPEYTRPNAGSRPNYQRNDSGRPQLENRGQDRPSPPRTGNRGERQPSAERQQER